ncbi:hypothetical protein HY339_00635 [Candidatus Gottesmanbacteria bacterium]|nr:hypothetical protein [Candidatus Gottesmanbacteria bacterium]
MHHTMSVLYILSLSIAIGLRLHLALTRFFDPDEFAHLHWAWLIAKGQLPYKDFFYYLTPGFSWILSLFHTIIGDSTNVLIASRLFLFMVYGLNAAIVYRLSKGSLMAVLIFLTFPLTLDKTIDVRPDMVMLLLYFASMMVKNSFLSGVLFGASVLMLPKIIFALPALVFLRSHPAKQGETLKKFLAGVVFIGILFLGYLRVNNLIGQFLTSITKDSFAVTGGKISFSPLLLLTPYPLIYVTKGGVSLPWAVNTAIWIAGTTGLWILLKKRESMGIFWALFIAGNILFVFLFPVPYVQYFLPLSVAASVLAGYALGMKNYELRIKNKGTTLSVFFLHSLFLILTSSSFFLQYRERVAPGAENAEQLQVIRDVLAVTKPNETIYDMVGSYVFRPDGYFICCHPYGEFANKLAHPPPALRESLTRRQTKFLVMDRVGFVFWQSPEPDKTFLLTHYLPTKYYKIYSLGQTFRCVAGACVQYNLNNQPASGRSTNTFTIVTAETYAFAIEPESESVTIDGRTMNNNQTAFLTAGPHRFSATPRVTGYRLLLSR